MDTTVVNFMFESGISLAIFALVYVLFLRKETFFVLNRIYLLASVVFSFLLPFIHFQVNSKLGSFMLDEVTNAETGYPNLLQTVFVYSTNLSGAFEKAIQSIGLIRLIYLSGTAIFLIIFLYRLLQITVLILKNESELKNGIRVVKIDRDTTPFSFFNFVFISKNNADSPGMREMLAHETEHVRQGHSFDVMIFELLTIFQWFNPFIWLLKRSIRENHEFLADNGVLKPGVSSAAYRMLLLNSSFLQQPVIVNNFNYSLIKIRIKMMTKIKSSKTAVLKLSMGVMVTTALLLIFAFDIDGNQLRDNKPDLKQAEVVDQQKSIRTKEPVFVKADQMPVFPGGESALIKFISDEVKYPDDAKKAGIQGKVIVSFVINKDGKVVNPKILRNVHSSIDQEALRVVKMMPQWKPGKNKGEIVSVQYTLPISFALK